MIEPRAPSGPPRNIAPSPHFCNQLVNVTASTIGMRRHDFCYRFASVGHEFQTLLKQPAAERQCPLLLRTLPFPEATQQPKLALQIRKERCLLRRTQIRRGHMQNNFRLINRQSVTEQVRARKSPDCGISIRRFPQRCWRRRWQPRLQRSASTHQRCTVRNANRRYVVIDIHFD